MSQTVLARRGVKTWLVVDRDAIDRMKDTYCLVCAHTVRLVVHLIFSAVTSPRLFARNDIGTALPLDGLVERGGSAGGSEKHEEKKVEGYRESGGGREERCQGMGGFMRGRKMAVRVFDDGRGLV